MRSKSSQYPLRRIIGARRAADGLIRELLECGHEIPEKSDIYGPSPAIRRRCRRCYRDIERLRAEQRESEIHEELIGGRS